MRKLKDQRGETILEVLLSLLIVSICIGFFVNSLVTANVETKKERYKDSFSFQYLTEDEESLCDDNGGTYEYENGEVITKGNGTVVVSDPNNNDPLFSKTVEVRSRDGYKYVYIQ